MKLSWELIVVLLMAVVVACSTGPIKAISLNCPEETGIPVHKHILIVKSARCCDTAVDKKGNHYHCYMIDRNKNLKAMLTKANLTPVKEFEEDVLMFYLDVRKEIQEDGGIKKLIERLEKSEECRCDHHRRDKK